MSEKDRKTPTMSLTPDRDDIVFRQQRPSRIGDVPNVKDSPSGGGGGGLATTLLLLIAAGFGVAVFFLYQQLELAKGQIEASQNRIVRLEKQLSITDETVVESSGAVEERIKFLDSEIRKLWDNVWKKTKDDLEAQDKRLAALESSLKGSAADLAAAKASLSEDNKRLTELKSQLGALSTQLKKTQNMAETNWSQIAELKGGGDASTEIARLEARIKANEDYIETVNAFRRQVNRDITSLRNTISSYHAAPGSAPAP